MELELVIQLVLDAAGQGVGPELQEMSHLGMFRVCTRSLGEVPARVALPTC